MTSAVARAWHSIARHFTSRGRGVSEYDYAVARVYWPAVCGSLLLFPAQTWTYVPGFNPARSPLLERRRAARVHFGLFPDLFYHGIIQKSLV